MLDVEVSPKMVGNSIGLPGSQSYTMLRAPKNGSGTAFIHADDKQRDKNKISGVVS